LIAVGDIYPFIHACGELDLMFLTAKMQLQSAAAGKIIIDDKNFTHSCVSPLCRFLAKARHSGMLVEYLLPGEKVRMRGVGISICC
jgi:hypothetical protein